MRIRRVAWAAASLVAAWLIVCTFAGIFAAEGALHPPRNPVTPQLRDRAQQLAATNHAQLADVVIEASDHATLRGWLIVPPDPNGDAVILLHGQADNRAGMLGPAAMLLRHGYSVLLPDARAHGESAGNLATYGVLERDDIRLWFDFLRQSEHPRCIDGLGDSMGAAQLLQSLSVEHGFCAVVAESAFSSFREVAYDRMGQRFHAGSWLGRTVLHPAVDFGFLYALIKYHVDLAQSSPFHAVAATPTPVLLIHGLQDDNIPPRHSEQIRQACPRVALWEPEYAGHCDASSTDPVEYEARVTAWFAIHDSGHLK